MFHQIAINVLHYDTNTIYLHEINNSKKYATSINDRQDGLGFEIII